MQVQNFQQLCASYTVSSLNLAHIATCLFTMMLCYFSTFISFTFIEPVGALWLRLLTIAWTTQFQFLW